MSEITLGLSEPDPIYLYIGDDEETHSCWYKLSYPDMKQVPVLHTQLTGYIDDIRLTAQSFKGKDVHKLNIVVQAGSQYIIRSGVGTNFSRSFLLAAEQITRFDEPYKIIVQKGSDDKIVFAKIKTVRNEQIKAEWDAEKKLFPIIQRLQKLLGVEVQTSLPKAEVRQ